MPAAADFLDIAFFLHFENPRWQPEGECWLIWANFQTLIILEPVGVRS